MSPGELQIVCGDTLAWLMTFPVVDQDGAQVDLSAWTIASQLRETSGLLIADLQASWLNAATGLLLLRAVDTTAWAIGTAVMSVRLTSLDGHVISSPSFRVTIRPAVTHG